MSTTLGPTVPILNEGAPSPPRYSLLSVAQIVADADLHYLSGAEVWPWVDARSSGGHDPCGSGTSREKAGQQSADDGDYPSSIPTFPSYTVYEALECTARGIRTEFDVWAARAIAALQAVESYQVEKQVSQGTILPLAPNFSDANVNILNGGAALSPERALGLLEEEASRTGAAHWVHIDPATAVALTADTLLEREGTELHVIGTGSRVVVGAGYVDAQPSGGAAPSATQSWMFATTPVFIRRSEAFVNPPTMKEALDRSNNDTTLRGERYYLSTWDTVLQDAVLVNLAA